MRRIVLLLLMLLVIESFAGKKKCVTKHKCGKIGGTCGIDECIGDIHDGPGHCKGTEDCKCCVPAPTPEPIDQCLTTENGNSTLHNKMSETEASLRVCLHHTRDELQTNIYNKLNNTEAAIKYCMHNRQDEFNSKLDETETAIKDCFHEGKDELKSKMNDTEASIKVCIHTGKDELRTILHDMNSELNAKLDFIINHLGITTTRTSTTEPTTTTSPDSTTTRTSTTVPTTVTIPDNTTTRTSTTVPTTVTIPDITTTRTSTTVQTTTTSLEGITLWCDELGGIYVGEQCLYFQTNWDEQLKWSTANEACLQKGGQLASLTHPTAVYDYAVANYGRFQAGFYAGGSDIAQEGLWMWLNGQRFASDFPWHTGEPNNAGGDEDCLVMYNDGYFDIPCHLPMRYICELGIALRCEQLGGIYVGEQCLYFQSNWDEKLSWTNASDACTQKGGQLARLTHPETVYDYAVANYGTFFYLGGSDIAVEGEWVWLNGVPFASNFPWASGEPNQAGNEDCLVMYDHGYYDIPCNIQMRYICQLD